MTVQRSSLGRDEIRVPTPPVALMEQPAKDLGRLGEALKARSEDVLRETVAQTIASGEVVDAVVQESFERIGATSTIAVARWIAGEGLEVTRDAGRETSKIFGELAAHRAASLNEVTRRCMWWRNVMAQVLRESAEQLDVSADSLSQALNMLQLSLEFSLLRMCECFETERKRTDEELTRREDELPTGHFAEIGYCRLIAVNYWNIRNSADQISIGRGRRLTGMSRQSGRIAH